MGQARSTIAVAADRVQLVYQTFRSDYCGASILHGLLRDGLELFRNFDKIALGGNLVNTMPLVNGEFNLESTSGMTEDPTWNSAVLIP